MFIKKFHTPINEDYNSKRRKIMQDVQNIPNPDTSSNDRKMKNSEVIPTYIPKLKKAIWKRPEKKAMSAKQFRFRQTEILFRRTKIRRSETAILT